MDKEKKVIGPIQIDGLYIPKGAKGVHKIEKVMFFNSFLMKYRGHAYPELHCLDKSGGYSKYQWLNCDYMGRKFEETANAVVTCGVVLLDNDVVINVMPGFGKSYSPEFSKVGQLLLLSEGETVEFVEAMQI